ncbi:MAG: SRPBCC family protein [Bacteroidota bacterium]|nr:SRPBCC family protein [Bacteroidota bacterium]
MSKTYQLTRVQQIPGTLEQVWDFFSDPGNLSVITPAELRFEVLSESPRQGMYPGQIIEYRVRPLLGIPLYWMTEITQVDPGKFFIDEQRYGPYSFWHHQHHFRETGQGVEMTDLVHYRLPLGWLGDFAQSLFVRARLDRIFAYRMEVTEKTFGSV